jgi:predicted ester cyclase
MGCTTSTPSTSASTGKPTGEDYTRDPIWGESPPGEVKLGHATRFPWSLDAQKLHRALHENFEEGKLDHNLNRVEDDVLVKLQMTGQIFKGKTGFMEFMKGFKDPFPDMKIQMVSTVVSGRKCFAYCQAKGTHNGPLVTPNGTIPPTGKSIVHNFTELATFANNGKLISLVNVGDIASLLAQIVGNGAAAPATTSAPTSALPDDVKTLSSKFRGTIFIPTTPGYDKVKMIWNSDPANNPAIILQCIDTADVKNAVIFSAQWEGKNDKAPKTVIRSGGHSLSGTSTSVGGIVIDLSSMRGIVVDKNEQTAWVEGGAKTGDLDRALYEQGFFMPAGHVSTTGVGGLMTAGGFGLISQFYGLMVDHIVACEVVTSDGRILMCTEKENADLLWGIKGAGQRLCVITRFKVRIHPLKSPLTLSGIMAWPANVFDKVFDATKKYVYDADDATGALALASPPDAGGAMLALCVFHYFGPEDKGKAIAQEMSKMIGMEPVNGGIDGTLKMVTWPEANSLIDATAPYNNATYSRGISVKDEDATKKLFNLYINEHKLPAHCMVVIESWQRQTMKSPKDALFNRVGKNCYAMYQMSTLIPGKPECAKEPSKAYWDTILAKATEMGIVIPGIYTNFDESKLASQYYDADLVKKLKLVKEKYDARGMFKGVAV